MPELFFGDYMVNRDYINSRYFINIVNNNIIEIEFYNHVNKSRYKFNIDFNIEFTDSDIDGDSNLYYYIMGKIINFYNPGY
jgi:hypothetical protein